MIVFFIDKGGVGIISGVLYVVKTSAVLRHSHHIRYSWAFGLDMAASCLVVFIAAVIGLTNTDRTGCRDGDSRSSRYGYYERAQQNSNDSQSKFSHGK